MTAGRPTLRACAAAGIGTSPFPGRPAAVLRPRTLLLGSHTLSFSSEQKSRSSRGEWRPRSWGSVGTSIEVAAYIAGQLLARDVACGGSPFLLAD
jgi:hypothetical protein